MIAKPGIPAGLQSVRERMARACDRAGRPVDSVRLIAVSKTVTAERVRRAIDAGQQLFGENRVQEALEKQAGVGPGPSWHMIGHLQSKKVRQIVGAFELIHSVDSLKLAAEIDKRCAAADVVQPILLQVNLSREKTKGGVEESELQPLLESVVALAQVEVHGLMTIPPPSTTPEDSRPWFSRLSELRDQAAGWLGRPLPELSMGMTDDFEVAIEEGATLVRVGRAIFGERSTT